MRKLSPGDVSARLGRIEKSTRSRRWKKAAKARLLADVGGYLPEHGHIIELPDGGKVCTKRRFPTFTAAFSALVATKRSLNGNRQERRVYLCSDCHAFHLTSMEYRHHDRAEEEDS